MEEAVLGVAVLLFLAVGVVPIVALVQIFKLRGEVRQQARVLEALGTHREAPPVSAPLPVALPVVRPASVEARTLVSVPVLTPVPARVPVPPAVHVDNVPSPMSVGSPVAPRSVPPVEPNAFQAKALEAMKKIWNWIVIGEEFRRPGTSWEYAVATNWLLRGGIVVVVVGVGFFLKYSIEHGYLGPMARVALSILTGVAMLIGGVRLVGKPYHLLGQGLMGGGLAILYFSMFSASNLYHLVGVLTAFGLMALVTLVAGTLAVRLNSLLVAVLGILGGYGTPILLSTGAKNFPGLFGYMLLLGVGILGISRRRNWPLLNYLGLVLTYGLATAAIAKQYVAADFGAVLPFLAAFFVLYAAVMVLHNLAHREKAGLLELLGIMANAMMFFGLAHHVITVAYPEKYAALPALALAAFFIVLTRIFLSGGRKDRGLLYTFLALAALFTALTPPLALSRQWVTASWALQGVVMLWLAGKIESRFLRLLGSAACLLAIGRLAFMDLQAQFGGRLSPETTWTAYLKIFGERVLSIGVPIAALGGAWKLLRRPPAQGGLAVAPENDMVSAAWQSVAGGIIAVLGCGVLFIYAHFELYRTCGFFYPPLAVPAMTLVWFALGWFLLAVWRQAAVRWVPILLVVLVVGMVIKMVGFDMDGWRLNCDGWRYGGEYLAGEALIRFADVGLYLALFGMIFAGTRGQETGRRVGLATGVAGLVLLFFYLTLEVNTVLWRFVPGLRAGGITLLWAAYALVLLLFGLRRGVPGLRYAGLLGFAVVTWKIFFADLTHLDPLYKIVAFIVLGVILLLAAWVYLKSRQRFQPVSKGDRA
ncbi:MAG: DUF2339 domain-containing protein [bacterium]